MKAIRRFFRRVASWTRSRQDEERLKAEIEEHLEAQIAENVRGGMPPVEARRQAMMKFGAATARKRIDRAVFSQTRQQGDEFFTAS